MQNKYTVSDLETSISKDYVAVQISPAIFVYHLYKTLLNQ